jgi:hypothetical protein
MWKDPNICICFLTIQWYAKYSTFVLLFVFHKIKYTSCAVAVKGQIFDDSFPSYWFHLLLSKKQNPFSKLKILPLLFFSWWCSGIHLYHERKLGPPKYLSLTIFLSSPGMRWAKHVMDHWLGLCMCTVRMCVCVKTITLYHMGQSAILQLNPTYPRSNETSLFHLFYALLAWRTEEPHTSLLLPHFNQTARNAVM